MHAPAAFAVPANSKELANQIVSFTLINADTDTDITTINNGATININTIGTRNLSIRANCFQFKWIQKVYLYDYSLDRLTHKELKMLAPFALFGDC